MEIGPAFPDKARISDLEVENAVLRAALHNVGAMLYMDTTGTLRFKDGFSNDTVLDTVNAALED